MMIKGLIPLCFLFFRITHSVLQEDPPDPAGIDQEGERNGNIYGIELSDQQKKNYQKIQKSMQIQLRTTKSILAKDEGISDSDNPRQNQLKIAQTKNLAKIENSEKEDLDSPKFTKNTDFSTKNLKIDTQNDQLQMLNPRACTHFLTEQKCLSCVEGYFLTQQDTCLQCSDPNCLSCSAQTHCNQCYNGFYLFKKKCHLMDIHACQAYQDNVGCITCRNWWHYNLQVDPQLGQSCQEVKYFSDKVVAIYTVFALVLLFLLLIWVILCVFVHLKAKSKKKWDGGSNFVDKLIEAAEHGSRFSFGNRMGDPGSEFENFGYTDGLEEETETGGIEEGDGEKELYEISESDYRVF